MFKNGRLFKKQVNCIPRVLGSSSPAGKNKELLDVISLIPPRVERTPTDILKALSRTVGRDPTAYHYLIPDDPIFYPLNSFFKKRRILAMESGKKSARWIIENNPGFFNKTLSEPPIQAFLNKPSFDENSEVTEETLQGLIQDRNVSQAITAYSLLQNKGTDISIDTKQSLLELVCFYNSKDKPDEKDLCNKWYETDKKKSNVWTDDGFVKTLFDNLEPTCPSAYAALIQGMLKHSNLDEAMELFVAAREKNIKLPVGVYNLILENVPHLEKDPFKRFEAVEDYLRQMAQEKLKPNLETLNSVLSAISKIDGISIAKKEAFICKLLVDFEYLKIYPSLGGYYYILKVFADQKDALQIGARVSWSIMDFVKTKRWTLQHPSDLLFFHSAMVIFCSTLRSFKLAQSLMEFYLDHDHYKFLNTNFAESQFFDNYISITFANQPLEESMKIYRDLVPSQTFLEPRKYWVVLRAIVSQKKFEYLEEIWKDMNQYVSHLFPKLTRSISLILTAIPHLKKEDTPRYFYEAAEMLFKQLDTAELESSTFGNMLIAFARFEDEEKVSALMDFVTEAQILFMETDFLSETFAFALHKKNISLMKNCLELGKRQNCSDLKTMAKEASPLLDEADRKWLDEILVKADKKNKREKTEGREADLENS